MGLLSKVGGLVSRIAPILPIPGAGIIGKLGGALSRIGLKTTAVAVGTGAAFGVGEYAVGRATGGGGGFPAGMPGGRVCIIGPDGHKYAMSQPRPASPGGRWYRCRPRGRGLSARDIRGAQKVARVVRYFGFKPKLSHHRRRR